jgi:hypothetical protein
MIGIVVVVIILLLQLPVQPMPITNEAPDEGYL